MQEKEKELPVFFMETLHIPNKRRTFAQLSQIGVMAN